MNLVTPGLAPGRRHQVPLLVAIAAITAALLWFSFAFTGSIVFQNVDPVRAVAGWRSAPALAALASSQALDERGGRNVASARALGIAALRREPGNVAALRSLGVVAALEGKTGLATALMQQSERLSRRDVPTQLWLIERAVGRGDIDAALYHYDRALSTSFNTRDLLLPILVQAASDPAIARALAARLARRPNWWEKAVLKFVERSEDPGSLALVLGRVRLDPRQPEELSLLTGGLIRIAKRGGVPAAAALYRTAFPRGTVTDTGLNDTFADDPLSQPFDWNFVSDTDLSASRAADPDRPGRYRLEIAATDRTGPVAVRLLTLRPGRYAIAAAFAGADQGVSLTLTCQRRAGESAPIVTAAGREAKTFVVPAQDCAGQWLSIVASSASAEATDMAAAPVALTAIRIRAQP